MGGNPTEPKGYRLIFERGIDPDVEDPEQCHDHSEVPDEWPAVGDILSYQERVRNRLRTVFATENVAEDRCLGEALWIGFEHEVMHLETFLYMLLQSESTLPPPGVSKPDFEKLSHQARANAKPNQWFTIPRQTLSVGLDVNADKMPADSFGWDNEIPQRTVTVPSFEAQARPITNGEFAKYLQANGIQRLPVPWISSYSDNCRIPEAIQHEDHATSDFMANFAVRTVFGHVPLELAQDWPFMASYNELSEYAQWKGCRIPTFEETKSIYGHAAELKESKRGGVVNGHRSVQDKSNSLP